jgi:hypothetical protein
LAVDSLHRASIEEVLMDGNTFDHLARHAAGAVSRRGSLRLLGGAGLAGAFAAPEIANAGKSRKKARKQCKQQKAQCLAAFREFCEPKAEPQSCEEGFFPCCEHFARCNAGAGIECIIAAA